MRGLQTLCGLALAEAQGRAGQTAEAHALAAHTLALAGAHQERSRQASALHLLGDLTMWRAPVEYAPAATHYRQALAQAAELGMHPLQAHCHRGLGILYAATGQREQARVALSTAIEMYQSMAMTFWLPETEGTLAQVDAR
jgi:tetratricopeptide (TPR) repeat protein